MVIDRCMVLTLRRDVMEAFYDTPQFNNFITLFQRILDNFNREPQRTD